MVSKSSLRLRILHPFRESDARDAWQIRAWYLRPLLRMLFAPSVISVWRQRPRYREAIGGKARSHTGMRVKGAPQSLFGRRLHARTLVIPLTLAQASAHDFPVIRKGWWMGGATF